MKKIIALLLISLPIFVQAQLDINVRYSVTGPLIPNINYYGTKKISEKISLTYFGLIERTWGEALIGVSYSPTSSLSISSSVGVEHGSKKPRFGASVWTAKGNTSLLVLTEKGAGADNYWYKVNLFQKVSDKFTFGATAWRFYGVGPQARFTSKKLSSTIWTLPAYDFEANNLKVVIGLTIAM